MRDDLTEEEHQAWEPDDPEHYAPRQREATENINDYKAYHWQSDWNGDEVGWDHIDVVGLYDILIDDIWKSAHIDASTGDILEWLEVVE